MTVSEALNQIILLLSNVKAPVAMKRDVIDPVHQALDIVYALKELVDQKKPDEKEDDNDA